jgi:hypothetical protein
MVVKFNVQRSAFNGAARVQVQDLAAILANLVIPFRFPVS